MLFTDCVCMYVCVCVREHVDKRFKESFKLQ